MGDTYVKVSGITKVSGIRIATTGLKGDKGTSIYADSGAPSNSLGGVGDVYINLTSWDFFAKVANGWTLRGSIKGGTGLQGVRGTQWITGPSVPSAGTGIDGDIHYNTATYNLSQKVSGTWVVFANIRGAVGPQGSTLRIGTTIPANTLGADGDSFINATTGDIFQRSSGAYVNQGNIRGPVGAAGSTTLNGNVAPTAGIGNVGDYYINTSTQDNYQKTSGGWQLLYNSRGATGASGATILAGTIVPTGVMGNNGDYYINTATQDFYGKSAGAWTVLFNIKGLKGDQGVMGISGILQAATAYTKGNVMYADASGAMNMLIPRNNELGLRPLFMTDVSGNLIARGHLVDVTGLGFVDGVRYYNENLDGNGRNVAALPSPVPVGLQATRLRSLFTLGQAQAVGTKMYLDFRSEETVLDNAYPGNGLLQYIFNDLTIDATPDTTKWARLLDIRDDNGNAETGGDNLTGLKTPASANLQGGSGWAASPVTKQVNGVATQVFFQEYRYGGLHASYSTLFQPQSEGDYLATFAFEDGGAENPGIYFSSTSGLLYYVILSGNPGDVGNATIKKAVINAAGTAPTVSNLAQTATYSSVPSKAYINMRVNVSPTGVVKVKFWLFDTTKTLLNQAQSEPAAWNLTYNNNAPFPMGLAGTYLRQNTLRTVMFSSSLSAAIPAAFTNGVGA